MGNVFLLDLRLTRGTLNPNAKRYTWRRRNPIKQARLDYYLCNETFMDIVSSTAIKPGYRSDHSFLELNLNTCEFKRGRGI